MQPKNKVRLIAGLTAMAVIGCAWRIQRSADAVRARLAAAARQYVALQGEIRNWENRMTAGEKNRADLQTALTRLKAVRVARVQKPVPAANFSGNPMELIMKDPTLQLLYLASRRAALSQTYGPLFLSLDLTPEQRKKFDDIVMKREEVNQDVLAVMAAQQLGRNDPSVVSLRQQAEDEFQSAQAELLGPTGYQALQQFERTMDARTTVSSFAGALALEGSPLTPQQGEQMTQLLANTSSAFRSGGVAKNTTFDWDLADQQLSAVLSPAQLKLYRTIEPLGGGLSPWMGRLGTLLNDAMKSELPNRGTLPNNPPGS